jgi:hypothetical protein
VTKPLHHKLLLAFRLSSRMANASRPVQLTMETKDVLTWQAARPGMSLTPRSLVCECLCTIRLSSTEGQTHTTFSLWRLAPSHTIALPTGAIVSKRAANLHLLTRIHPMPARLSFFSPFIDFPSLISFFCHSFSRFIFISDFGLNLVVSGERPQG